MKIISVFVFVICANTAILAQPQILFDTYIIDMGVFEAGTSGQRAFVFTNVGTEPLIIKYATSSCGCTTSKAPKGPIMPGESAILYVRIMTKIPRRKFITTFAMITNDPVHPRSVLTLTGNMVPAGFLQN